MEVRIYVEGGGDTSGQKAQLRLGFSEFLREMRDLARSRSQKFQVICCGGRDSTLEDFRNALQDHPDAFNVLLVDAEANVSKTPRAHLEQRDGWKLADLDDEQVHLMVALMEAWFLADVEALELYFGAGFRAGVLPKRPNVEENLKSDVERGLEEATRNSKKGRYRKMAHSPELLKKIAPATVRNAAPHCQRLFATLETQIQR